MLRRYAERNSQCNALGTCSGAVCQLSGTNANSDASFVVTKCVDPVMVDVRVQSRMTGDVSIQQGFNHSDSVFLGGTSLYVKMGRNATDLQFEVDFASNN